MMLDPVTIAILLVVGLVVGSITDRLLHWRRMRAGAGFGKLVQTSIMGALGALLGAFAGSLMGLEDVPGLNVASFLCALAGTVVVMVSIALLTGRK
jgi:uncharacterized membrane protein YeaQ/YmgE (transglycosylase-associated protein family)